MTEIFLIRHVQSEGNIYRVMQGHWDGEVTALGRLQQQALRERFETIPVDRVYSSDLIRACFTAEAVASPKGLDVIRDKRLREIDIGPWEGQFFGNVCRDEPESAQSFMYRADEWRHEGAESYAEVGRRVYEALREIAEANDGKRVAVVSHGVSIRSFLSLVTGLPLSDTEALPIFHNTSVSTLRCENGIFTPLVLGDCSHLPKNRQTAWSWTGDLRHESMDPMRDRQYYTDCYADSWLAAHGSLDRFEPSVYLLAACKHYARDPRAILKLYDGDTAVGLLDLDTVKGRDEGWGWISLLYLCEDYRGKGYGIQALARAIMLYRALDRKELRLHVAEDNVRAVRFYERQGFRLLKKSGGLLLMGRELHEI